MFCSNCGNQMAENANFCAGCGANNLAPIPSIPISSQPIPISVVDMQIRPEVQEVMPLPELPNLPDYIANYEINGSIFPMELVYGVRRELDVPAAVEVFAKPKRKRQPPPSGESTLDKMLDAGDIEAGHKSGHISAFAADGDERKFAERFDIISLDGKHVIDFVRTNDPFTLFGPKQQPFSSHPKSVYAVLLFKAPEIINEGTFWENLPESEKTPVQEALRLTKKNNLQAFNEMVKTPYVLIGVKNLSTNQTWIPRTDFIYADNISLTAFSYLLFVTHLLAKTRKFEIRFPMSVLPGIQKRLLPAMEKPIAFLKSIPPIKT